MATTRSYNPNPGLLIQVFDIDFSKNPPKKTVVGVINPDTTLEFTATKINSETGEELYQLGTVYGLDSISNSFKGKYVEMLPSVSHKGEPQYNFSPTNEGTARSGESNISVNTNDSNSSSKRVIANYKQLQENWRKANPGSDLPDLQTLLNMVVNNTGSTVTDKSMYLKSLQGLDVKEIRNIMGVPRQFLPITDIRTNGKCTMDSIAKIGVKYAEKILKTMPLLLMTPGKPKFMKSFSNQERRDVLSGLLSGAGGLSGLADGYTGKYYSLDFAYEEYYKYVNPMLRSAALFLGIGTEVVDGKALNRFDWLTDRAKGSEIVQSTNALFGSVLSNITGLGGFVGPYVGAIAFYADVGPTTTDSFANSTTESQLASQLNNLSDQARELHFLTGFTSSHIGGAATEYLNEKANGENSSISEQGVLNEMHNGGGVMQALFGKAQVILAGGRLLFPKIWADSSFGRSYHCNMKLVSPSGDKLSVYLNILVPIFHLLGFVLPRQGAEQAYFSPFLLRAYCKGSFNMDMGIMGNLTISRGIEGEWTVDGLPTVADVSFELQDLYEGLFMTSVTGPLDTALFNNTMELDYIANMCGININDQESFRTIKLWLLLQGGGALDKLLNTPTAYISQFINQAWQNIMGIF